MRSTLEQMAHGAVRVVGGCVVAKLGDTYYTAGDSCHVLYNTPRSLDVVIEFINDYQAPERWKNRHPVM